MCMGLPPGYYGVVAALEGLPEYLFHLCDQNKEERRRVKALPPEALAELKDVVHGRREYEPDGICIWLDMETRQCRYYKHRPTICSGDAVEIGNDACLTWRKDFGIR